MAQFWTFIFVATLAGAFGLAHWHDCEEAKQRGRRNMAHEQKDRAED